MNAEVELKDCPFCNSKTLRKVRYPRISEDYQSFTMQIGCVECLNCGASGPHDDFVKDCIASWNKRVYDDM